MRKVFLLTIAILACAANTFAQQATIEGRIKGHKGNDIVAITLGNADTLKVGTDGVLNYKVTIPERSDEVTLIGIGASMLSFKAANNETVGFTATIDDKGALQAVFTGYEAALNNYNFALATETAYTAWPQNRVSDAGSFEAYKADVDAMIGRMKNKLTTIADTEVRTGLADELELMQKYFYMRYAWFALREDGEEGKMKEDAAFTAFAESIDLADPRMFGERSMGMMYSYSGIAESRLRWEMERAPEKYRGDNRTVRYLVAVGKLVADPRAASHLAGQAYENYAIMGGDEFIDETFAAYRKLNNDPAELEKFEKKYNEMSALRPGKMAPDFTIIDAEGNKKMLSDLRGKVLYIDIWATWCGPCVAEIPFVEKLWEKYRDSKTLEFVSISVDDDIDAWKQKLATDNPGWRNFVTEGGFRGPLNSEYHISGIPRFLLIDKDGSIISVNAPRPSSPNIEQYLEPYL